MSELLSSQRRYYAARALEYDDWWFRRGRFALPPEREAAWNADVAELEAALEDFQTRSVADGREFDIVKRHWDPEELEQRVRPLGFDLGLRSTANGHFLYGGSR